MDCIIILSKRIAMPVEKDPIMERSHRMRKVENCWKNEEENVPNDEDRSDFRLFIDGQKESDGMIL